MVRLRNVMGFMVSAIFLNELKCDEIVNLFFETEAMYQPYSTLDSV